MTTNIHDLLEMALSLQASELILEAGATPTVRVDGCMHLMDLPPLSPEQTHELVYEILFSASREVLLRGSQTDNCGLQADPTEQWMKDIENHCRREIGFTIPNIARVRASLFLQRNTIAAFLRLIPWHPYSIEDLGLPHKLKCIVMEPQGLIIVTGPAGAGKTTTMAALLEEINRHKCANISTIEDPIEYVLEDKKSIIHQREVGGDTQSFATGLRSLTRQSPDVIAISELSDPETIAFAMTAAEVGHLVITTLKANSVSEAIDRIVNSFPQHLGKQVRQQLGASLLCITSQCLVRSSHRSGRLPVMEVMISSSRVQKQLEEGNTTDLNTCIHDGGHFGMNTMNQALENLCCSQAITYEEGIQFADDPAELRQMLRRH